MRAFAITILDNEVSRKGLATLDTSSRTVGNEFPIELFMGISSETECLNWMIDDGLRWTYPWEGTRIDIATGLHLSAYQTRSKIARIGCFLSHYQLWKKCVEENENILILEHDAVFIKKFDLEISDGFIVGINDPRGATRKAQMFHEKIQNDNRIKGGTVALPRIDVDTIPQGLAGNSAYVMTPSAAENIIKLVKRVGCWPNDALMCYQNIKGLRVTKDYYTKVQGLPSTTTL